jgi:hypothetical protein
MLACCRPAPTTTPIPTLAQIYALQTFAATTPAAPPTVTPYPRSYAALEIAVSTSTTRLHVGDQITITVRVTNTGKLQLDQIGCVPYFYFEDGIEQRYSNRPDLLDASTPPGSFLFDLYVLPIGSSTVTTFTVEALNLGTASMKVSISALTRFSKHEPESWVGFLSEPITIQVDSK